MTRPDRVVVGCSVCIAGGGGVFPLNPIRGGPVMTRSGSVGTGGSAAVGVGGSVGLRPSGALSPGNAPSAKTAGLQLDQC